MANPLANASALSQGAQIGNALSRNTEVSSQLQDLYTNVTNLEEACNTLYSIINAHRCIDKNDQSVPESALCPMANDLRGINQRIQEVVQKIRSNEL